MTAAFCAAVLVYNASIVVTNHEVFGWLVNSNLLLGFVAAALTIGCQVRQPFYSHLAWPGSSTSSNYFWLCETLGLTSVALSAPLLHVAVLSRANVLQARLDAKQARRVLV